MEVRNRSNFEEVRNESPQVNSVWLVMVRTAVTEHSHKCEKVVYDINNHESVTLSEKQAFLSNPQNYAEDTAQVEAVETHMSLVFLTDAFVYKLKKPIQIQSLDYRSLARRKHCCFESLRLNRRLAASVYIDVVSLIRDNHGALRFDDDGEIVEWLEKMQRLPAESMLDSRLAEGTVSVQDVEAVAHLLTNFYAGLEPIVIAAAAYRQRLQNKIEFHIHTLSRPELAVPNKLLRDLSNRLNQFVTDRSELFDERVDCGRIVEGHGDLRPEHVCLTEPPVIIDCLEFDRDLRTLDVADELSYLAMECEFLGQDSFGQLLLTTYSELSGDRPDPLLLNFYKAYRAMIRATLAAWHLPDYPPAEHPKWIARCIYYCSGALGYAKSLSD